MKIPGKYGNVRLGVCSLCDWFHPLGNYRTAGVCGRDGGPTSQNAICSGFEVTPLDFMEDDHIIDDILINEFRLYGLK